MRQNSIRIKYILFVGLMSFIVGGCATQQKNVSLVGEIKENYYIHPSGFFRVKIDNRANISDSQASVKFTQDFLGSITGWKEIAFVKPELSIDKSSNEVIEIIINEMTSILYKGKEITPSFLLKDEREAFGIKTTYAKVIFPEFPGMGVLTFTDKGQKDADFIGHFQIVPIENSQLQQRNLPIRYLYISSLFAKPFVSGDEGLESHESFLKRIEFSAK